MKLGTRCSTSRSATAAHGDTDVRPLQRLEVAGCQLRTIYTKPRFEIFWICNTKRFKCISCVLSPMGNPTQARQSPQSQFFFARSVGEI